MRLSILITFFPTSTRRMVRIIRRKPFQRKSVAFRPTSSHLNRIRKPRRVNQKVLRPTRLEIVPREESEDRCICPPAPLLTTSMWMDRMDAEPLLEPYPALTQSLNLDALNQYGSMQTNPSFTVWSLA